jgi:hypothetical protein
MYNAMYIPLPRGVYGSHNGAIDDEGGAAILRHDLLAYIAASLSVLQHCGEA